MATNINSILDWFKTGKKPTQEQFWATWQSFWHKDEKIPQNSIINLTNTLNAKAEKSELDAHKNDPDAHPDLFTAGDNITITNNVISASGGNLFGDSDNLATGNRVFDAAANNFTFKNINEFNITGSSTPSFISYIRLSNGIFYSTEIPGKWIFMELYNGIPKSLVNGDELLVRLTIDSIEEEILFTASLLPEGGDTLYYWIPAREGSTSVVCNGFYGDTDTSIVKMAVATGTPNSNSIAYFDDNQLKKGKFAADLQSVTNGGNVTSHSIIVDDSYNDQITKINTTGVNCESRSDSKRYTNIGAGGLSLNVGNNQANLSPHQLSFGYSEPGSAGGHSFVITNTDIAYNDGIYGTGGNRLNFKRTNGDPNISPTFNFPEKLHGTYTLATTEEMGTPVSATQSGFVDNTQLQELGGTDKAINGIRIGKGNANYENNLVIGRNGLASVTTGKYNVAIGNGDGDVEGPLQYLTTGNNNTMVGSDAGISTTIGSNNTGIGTSSLLSNTTGNSNTAIGTFSLTKNLTSPYNVAIGTNALSKMESGLGQSTAIGAFCMSDATSTDKNAAIGTYALRYNTSGFSNVAFGHTALGLNTSGNSNNALGNYSLGAVTTGAANIGIGKFAGMHITTGIGNIYIGSEGSVTDAEASGIINIGNRFIAKGAKISLVGNLNIGTAPVYEDNTNALAGGLVAGDVYRTSAGVLMITF
ncbi:hypothetical protein [Flavobacterium sp. FlaQc-48]|uniref:hypothetical protein n=1 Tax=Flavobacterium sp. FlaQc-48 TaxID=3374181 RepID=UPI003756340A